MNLIGKIDKFIQDPKSGKFQGKPAKNWKYNEFRILKKVKKFDKNKSCSK